MFQNDIIPEYLFDDTRGESERMKRVRPARGEGGVGVERMHECVAVMIWRAYRKMVMIRQHHALGDNKGRRRQATTIATCNDVVGP